ncbi:hypothetical protein ACHAWF_008188 [Thalassiosira exigua]
MDADVVRPLLRRDEEEQPERPASTPATAATTTSVSLEFVDHFSLRQPSSTIRSRGVTTRVYDLDHGQMQLEQRSEVVAAKEGADEDGGEKEGKSEVKVVTTMKRLGDTNVGIVFLRLWYAMVALLMAGFTFVFASYVIVMQAMEIPRTSGEAAGTTLNVPVMVANVLALPLLVYSMSSLMIFCLVFVRDTWNGHVTFNLLLPAQVPRVYLEWYSFIMYLGIPVLVLCIAAFAGAHDAKRIGGLTWYCCMLLSFFIFCALVFYNEMKLCMDLTKYWHQDLLGFGLVRQAVLTTLTQRYCGVENRYFLLRQQGAELTSSTLSGAQPLRIQRSLYSRLTLLSKNPFFFRVDPPTRRYSMKELSETVPIVTNKSWVLDKAYCGLRNGRSQFAVSGPDAIELRQSKSGVICSVVGIALGCLIAVAVLYSAGILTGAAGIIIVCMLILGLVGVPCIWSAVQVHQAMTLPQAETDDDGEDDDPVAQTWASYTVARPKESYCWFRLGLAFVLFFLWPVITLFASNLPKSGVLFLFTSIFSAARLNLDAGATIREHSSLSRVDFLDEGQTNEQQMLARARAAEVLGRITHSALYFLGIVGFGFMGAYFVYFSSTSVGSGEDYTTQTGREPIRLLDDFFYPPQNRTILYPNCELTDQFAFPGLDKTYALDYNLMAGIAYETTNVTTYLLDKWFLRDNAVVEEADFVNQWRQDSGNALEQVSFKLFSFPSSPGVGVLSIRGTDTPMVSYGLVFVAHLA